MSMKSDSRMTSRCQHCHGPGNEHLWSSFIKIHHNALKRHKM